MREVGYTLAPGGGGSYTFANEEVTRVITFDHGKYLPKELRVHFQMVPPGRKKSISFYLEFLNPNFFPPIKIEQYNDDSQYMHALLEQIIRIILPYMDILEKNVVSCNEEMYQSLSMDTFSRAERFASKWKLSLEPDESHGELDAILRSMQPRIWERKIDFYKHLPDIIDLAAYLGEVLNFRQGTPRQWYWRELSPTERFFAIQATGYDVLSRVIAAWNAGQEIINYSLVGLF
jgi:hypothetical protein